ncbi:recombinase family protein [Candidatus Bipolaricaulota bacterium]|nr:recombinase family protein [Candidatus Bipolaricaulota bacterium]MBS3792395.1 recombinase family protein [Candidatus Bipolaricaulota bacterium]MBS3813016.1 recombinase family protein [Candidatus Bipolaricaulota bacterium]
MNEENTPKRAVSYTRVSTREQSEDGQSLQNQHDRIEAYCKAKDYELVDSFSDAGASAKDLNREGLQSLIEEIKDDSIDVVVIYKLDRLTRSVKDLGRLIDDIFGSEDVALASVKDSFDTTTANGRMVMNLLATVAQWERETVAERTEDALDHKKQQGEWTGRVPFGFKVDEDGKLVEDPNEQDKIQKVKRAKRRGRSYREIADTYDISRGLAHKLINTNLRTLKKKYGVG